MTGDVHTSCPIEDCEWESSVAYASHYNHCPLCGANLDRGPRGRNVYLAGPVQHSYTGGHGWRDAVVNEWPDRFNWLNPLDELDAPDSNLKPSEDHHKVIASDKATLDRADAILVGWNHEVRSRGTMSELVLAGEVFNIPVALWNRTHADPNELSFWVHDYSTMISEDLPEVLDWLEAKTL